MNEEPRKIKWVSNIGGEDGSQETEGTKIQVGVIIGDK